MRIAGAIIAGGRGERMGGRDKPLLSLAGRPLIAHVAHRLAPQVEALAINANGDPARFAGLRLPVIPDRPGPGAGPLAGLAAALGHFAAEGGFTHLATAPADAPFVPADLVARLSADLGSGTIAVAASAGRRHPLCALWPTAISEDLARHLATAGNLSMMAFLDRHDWIAVEFACPGGTDPFFNVNTPEDLEAAEDLLAR